jgi:hypothetical protein
VITFATLRASSSGGGELCTFDCCLMQASSHVGTSALAHLFDECL